MNPPVHAWAALHVFRRDGGTDLGWLRQVFERLIVNSTWWVARNDPDGNGTFSGGFLGMDNIGPFDRGAMLPDGVTLEQADATGWMALELREHVRDRAQARAGAIRRSRTWRSCSSTCSP